VQTWHDVGARIASILIGRFDCASREHHSSCHHHHHPSCYHHSKKTTALGLGGDGGGDDDGVDLVDIHAGVVRGCKIPAVLLVIEIV